AREELCRAIHLAERLEAALEEILQVLEPGHLRGGAHELERAQQERLPHQRIQAQAHLLDEFDLALALVARARAAIRHGVALIVDRPRPKRPRHAMVERFRERLEL